MKEADDHLSISEKGGLGCKKDHTRAASVKILGNELEMLRSAALTEG